MNRLDGFVPAVRPYCSALLIEHSHLFGLDTQNSCPEMLEEGSVDGRRRFSLDRERTATDDGCPDPARLRSGGAIGARSARRCVVDGTEDAGRSGEGKVVPNVESVGSEDLVDAVFDTSMSTEQDGGKGRE
jgi:hypothetical protein